MQKDKKTLPHRERYEDSKDKQSKTVPSNNVLQCFENSLKDKLYRKENFPTPRKI